MKILLMTSRTVIGAYDAPPIGLYRLKNQLNKNGYECDVLDTCLDTYEEYLKKAKDYQIIGFSVTHNQMQDDIEIIKEFRKKANKECLFIAGGQEATYNHKEWLNLGIEIVLIGYSERTIVELAKAFDDGYKEGKKKLNKIKGIAYKENKKIIFRPNEKLTQEEFIELTYKEIKNLDVPYKRYWDKGSKDTGGLNLSKSVYIPETVRLYTSSSCPHQCGFCCAHRFLSYSYGTKIPIFRLTAEQIFDLVLFYIKNYGAKGFLFSDDEFLIDKNRSIAFCDLIIEAKQKGLIDQNILFNCQARVLDFIKEKKVDTNFIKKLHEAGFHSIGMGIETFSKRLLLCPSMNKPGYYKEQCLDVISALLEEGIVPIVFLILFIPETTKEEIVDTIKTAIYLMKKGAGISINPSLRALPGAPIYNDPKYPMYTIKLKNKNVKSIIQTHIIPQDIYIAQAAEKIMGATDKEISYFEQSKKYNFGKVPKTILGLLMFIATAKLLDRTDIVKECEDYIDEIISDLKNRGFKEGETHETKKTE